MHADDAALDAIVDLGQLRADDGDLRLLDEEDVAGGRGRAAGRDRSSLSRSSGSSGPARKRAKAWTKTSPSSRLAVGERHLDAASDLLDAIVARHA